MICYVFFYYSTLLFSGHENVGTQLPLLGSQWRYWSSVFHQQPKCEPGLPLLQCVFMNEFYSGVNMKKLSTPHCAVRMVEIYQAKWSACYHNFLISREDSLWWLTPDTITTNRGQYTKKLSHWTSISHRVCFIHNNGQV